MADAPEFNYMVRQDNKTYNIIKNENDGVMHVL